ncbi:hypothetical protein [Methylomagnum ishizawai]|nr:hypothetical protein [Methylomagnum ishizawai]
MNPPIYAALSSIPGREDMLSQVVASILPQVDHLYLCLDGHREPPDFLRGPGHDKITLKFSQRGYPKAKFAMIESIEEGIILSIDDDIAYPEDYAKTLVAGLRKYPGPTICGFHGHLFTDTPDFTDVSKIISYQRTLKKDTYVHAVGSGIAAWDARYCKVKAEHFPFSAGADSQLAVLGQKNRWPFVLLSHTAKWLVPLWPEGTDGIRRVGESCIWTHTKKNLASRLNARPANQWAVAQVEQWVLHTHENKPGPE